MTLGISCLLKDGISADVRMEKYDSTAITGVRAIDVTMVSEKLTSRNHCDIEKN